MNINTFWQRPVFWISIPLLAVLAGIAWLGVYEIRAGRDYQDKIAALKEAGRPVSNADLSRLYDERTSTENSKLWHDTIYLLNVPNHENETSKLPYVDIEPKTVVIDLSEPWEFEQQAGELLEKHQPAIDQLHTLTSNRSGPVWFPLNFEGFNTVLSHISGILSAAEVLQLETEYALRTNDAQRAARAIGDIFAIADSIDLTFGMSLSYQNSIRSGGYAMIRRSLSAGQWTPEQIDTLAKLTREPAELRQIWPAILDNEIAAVIATLEGPVQSFIQLQASLPSSKATMLQSLEQLREVNTSDLLSFRNETTAILDTAASPIIEMLGINGFSHFISAALLAENDRRLTQAAVEVKRYHAREGSWPDTLADISAGNITSIDHQSFGYEVDSGVAYLWKHRTPDGNDIAQQFPFPISKERPKKFSKREHSLTTMPLVTVR
ncbi:MAG: hypothetical protein Aurels2KO_17660 [Aureliella sp.]